MSIISSHKAEHFFILLEKLFQHKKNCSAFKKNVPYKKSLKFDLVFNISSQRVVLSDFDLDNNFGKYDCVTP